MLSRLFGNRYDKVLESLMEAPETLYGISKDEMKQLLLAKQLRRLEKGQTFDCFGMNYPEFKSLLKLLSRHLHDLPDETRFQLAVGTHYSSLSRDHGETEHWLLIDFYIENNTLHTFTLDAVGIRLQPILSELVNRFPVQKHYYFDNAYGCIQYTGQDCQTFVREQAGLLSNLPAKDLYQTLNKNCQQKGTRQAGTRHFTLQDFEDDNSPFAMLMPLLRSIQSFKMIGFIAEELQAVTVSNSKNLSFNHWYTKFAVLVGEDYQNHAIQHKDKKYAIELADFKKSHSKTTTPNGLGFVALMAKVAPYLDSKNKVQTETLISELMATLDHVPQLRANRIGEFFNRKALHYDRAMNVKAKLNALLLRKDQLCEADLKVRFKNEVANFADYLVENASVRTFGYLEDFFRVKLREAEVVKLKME